MTAIDRNEAVRKLTALLAHLVAEAGEADERFDPEEALEDWLSRRVPAIGGQRPGDLLEDEGGYEAVRRLILQMYYGSYA